MQTKLQFVGEATSNLQAKHFEFAEESDMVKIIDTYSQINSLFEDETFSLDKWELYINSIYDNSAHIFKDDLREYLDSGTYTYEKDFLPIINAVNKNPSLDHLHNSFTKVTENLNARIIECFGNELDVEIVLYLGLWEM